MLMVLIVGIIVYIVHNVISRKIKNNPYASKEISTKDIALLKEKYSKKKKKKKNKKGKDTEDTTNSEKENLKSKNKNMNNEYG